MGIVADGWPPSEAASIPLSNVMRHGRLGAWLRGLFSAEADEKGEGGERAVVGDP